MNSPVIIKGNKWGIKLIIHSEATLDNIIYTLRSKLQNTCHYYKNIKPITVTFEGKHLTEDEKEALLDTLREIGLNIKTLTPKIQCENFDKTPTINSSDGLFFIGNLKSGQSIDASESIIIVGDVDAGATVYSEGNVIIIGALNGYAESGYKGRNDTFVYSLISGGKE